MQNKARGVKTFVIFSSLFFVSLSGCGGNSKEPSTAKDESRSDIIFSHPPSGATNVNPDFSLTLLYEEKAPRNLPEINLIGPDNAPIRLEPSHSENKSTIIYSSPNPLRHGSTYTIKSNQSGLNYDFSTTPQLDRPAQDNELMITNMIPNGSDLPFFDFSTIRLHFNEKIDLESVSWDESSPSFALIDSHKNIVKSEIYVKNNVVIIDPEDDLLPTTQYTLTVSPELASVFGKKMRASPFGGGIIEIVKFTPTSTMPPEGLRAIMASEIFSDHAPHPITGKSSNIIPLTSILLGDTSIPASGNLPVELSFIPEHPVLTPFTIRKGAVINGDIVPINLAGKHYSGFSSGNSSITFLSDAFGVMQTNTHNPEAPREVRIWMDIAISSDDPTAHASITQSLLSIELAGFASVIDGEMNISATGLVQPELMGVENAQSLLSFKMVGGIPYHDDGVSTQPSSLAIVSFSHQSGQTSATHEPIVVTFNHALKQGPWIKNVQIEHEGEKLPSSVYVDGANLIITPKIPFPVTDNTDSPPATIKIPSSAESLLGPRLANTEILELPLVVTASPKQGTGYASEFFLSSHAPLILSSNLGMPCSINAEEPVNTIYQGPCHGAHPGVSGVKTQVPEDDYIPIAQLDTYEPIRVVFNKNMMDSSFVYGTTVIVTSIDKPEDILPGRITALGDLMEFQPDTPWEPGKTYRITIRSAGYEETQRSGRTVISVPDNVDCGMNAVCDVEGLPLQTNPYGLIDTSPTNSTDNKHDMQQVVAGTPYTAGGPDFQYFFTATNKKSVSMLLKMAPIVDTNSNFIHDVTLKNLWPNHGLDAYQHDNEEKTLAYGSDSRFPDLDPGGMLPGINSAKIVSRQDSQGQTLISGIEIGCGAVASVNEQGIPQFHPLDCPERKFTYLNGALFSNITNKIDHQGRIIAEIIPSHILSTSLEISGIVFIELFPGGPVIKARQPGITGPQFMRIRYATDSNGERTLNPEGVIFYDSTKDALLFETTLDFYLDVPFMAEKGMGTTGSTNSRSYPFSMTLSGDVSFTESGRIVINQQNTNPVDILLEAYANNGQTSGYVDLMIPEQGTNIQFQSVISK